MGVKCPGRPPKCWYNDIMGRMVRQMQRMTKVTTMRRDRVASNPAGNPDADEVKT